MSENENRRSIVLSRVSQRTLTLDQAARILALSSRHMKRIWKRFRQDGERGLAHGNRGRPSNRAFSEEFKKEILKRYQEHAPGLGPTSFAGELGEQGITIDHETLRRWLLENDLWKLRRTRHMTAKDHRGGRSFGEVLTLASIPSSWIDASFPAACLLCVRDEATSMSAWALASEEASAAAMRLLWLWVDRHGIPAALRCQRRFMLNDNRHPTLQEQLAGSEQRTPFARSCDRLGIDAAVMVGSQARRVFLELSPLTAFLERELARLPAISFEDVTAALRGPVGDSLNSLFSTRPEAAADYHVPIVDGTDLRSIFCTQREQNVGPDLVIEHNHRRFRLETVFENTRTPIQKIVVSEWLDGSLHFLLKDMELHFQEVRTTRRRSDKLAM